MRMTLPALAAGLGLGLLTACSGAAPPPPSDAPLGPAHGARGADVPEGLQGAPTQSYDTTVSRRPPTEIRPLSVQKAESNNPL